jgi:hypothetical protein
MQIEKASLTRLDTLESLHVLWNPERYTIARRSRIAVPETFGSRSAGVSAVCGGSTEFCTDLLLDRTRTPYLDQDLGAWSATLARWMDPEPGRFDPSAVLFQWGRFRFRGVISAIDELWILFAADGSPRRGWLRLSILAGA